MTRIRFTKTTFSSRSTLGQIFGRGLLVEQASGSYSALNLGRGKSQVETVAVPYQRSNRRLLDKFAAKAAALLLLLISFALTGCGIPTEIAGAEGDGTRTEIAGAEGDGTRTRTVTNDIFVYDGLNAHPYQTATAAGVELHWNGINDIAQDITSVVVSCRNLDVTSSCPDPLDLVFTPEEMAAFTANDAGSYRIDGLTAGGNYSFELLLASNQGTNITIVELTHRSSGELRERIFISSNLDADEYVDSDPLETDEDNDGLLDEDDQCDVGGPFITSFANWDASQRGNEPQQDYDGDGCRNDEDHDTDNDGVFRVMDLCPYSPRGFASNITADSDSDGCSDSGEDMDVGNNDGYDNDGISPAAGDRDNDGDGLIDISNAAELNNIRHNLAGTDYRDSSRAAADFRGCHYYKGGYELVTNSCQGYNLVADITLSGQWQPIGSCASAASCAGSDELKFSGIFDGKHYLIYGLTISGNAPARGLGFFGAIAPSAELRNVVLSGTNLAMTTTTTEFNGVRIDNQHANDVGALAGFAEGATLRSNRIFAREIIGGNNTGGLVGYAANATLIGNAALVFTRDPGVQGQNNVGGLAGDGRDAFLAANGVMLNEIGTRDMNRGRVAGGLVGDGRNSRLRANFVAVPGIRTRNYAGGLVGLGNGATIHSSYVVAGLVQPSGSYADGLIGNSGDNIASEVVASYWQEGIGYLIEDRLFGPDVGMAQSQNALRGPTRATGIYRAWGNVWCNPATGDFTTNPNVGMLPGYLAAWDFGAAGDYPTLACIPIRHSIQDNAIVNTQNTENLLLPQHVLGADNRPGQ